MTEIFLIRHTQAEGNESRMMQGHWDGDITKLGEKQIAALAERFKDVRIDALVSSDLYRTRATATAITKYHGIEMKTDPRLREIMVGPWETRYFGDIEHESPELLNKFLFDPENFYFPGIESYYEVQRRMCAAMFEIAQENEGKTVAVVSHGAAIRCFMSYVIGVGFNDKSALPIFDNTAVSRLVFSAGHFTCDYMNDTSHLDPISLPEWGKAANLRGEPVDPSRISDLYARAYRDTWIISKGSEKGYREETYLSAACEHYRTMNESVMELFDGDVPAGLLDLDVKRGMEDNTGWISLLYLMPEYRGHGCAAQLLSRAEQMYKKLGRRALRLTVSETNEKAVKFYFRSGFEKISEIKGIGGRLLLLEKSFDKEKQFIIKETENA